MYCGCNSHPCLGLYKVPQRFIVHNKIIFPKVRDMLKLSIPCTLRLVGLDSRLSRTQYESAMISTDISCRKPYCTFFFIKKSGLLKSSPVGERITLLPFEWSTPKFHRSQTKQVVIHLRKHPIPYQIFPCKVKPTKLIKAIGTRHLFTGAYLSVSGVIAQITRPIVFQLKTSN